MSGTIFILGGTGFIGKEVVAEALSQGFDVRGLARSAQAEATLRELGAEPVKASVDDPSSWAQQARGSDVLIDLIQPKFPKRLSGAAVSRLSEQRQQATAHVLDALKTLPAAERPLLFSVSGVDDLQPDADGRISDHSRVSAEPEGLSRIGVPVRRLIDESGLEATYVYFGVMVYGPGKVFADVYVEGIKKRRAPIIGSGENRLPLTYLTDAARALVHLAGQPRHEIAGRTFVATDGATNTQRELLEHTAALMGAKPPRSVPAFVAGLAAGSAAADTMVFDARAEPAGLLKTGFQFRYPSYREGVPALLDRLGARDRG
jgi:nucleoside-diphosphate-sugar epimerase